MSVCPNCGYEPRKGRRMYWTEARIIDAIQNWANNYGNPPRMNDWQTASPSTPSQATVRDRFGTWNHAITAAGFTPIPWRRRTVA